MEEQYLLLETRGECVREKKMKASQLWEGLWHVLVGKASVLVLP